MIIPSIDLMNGKVVQLEQGRKKKLEITQNPIAFAKRFSSFPAVQVVDLDAAMEKGGNLPIVKKLCKVVNARVGGGIRSVERAVELVEAGAKKVIIGTMANKEFLTSLKEKIGKDKIIVALDNLNGKIVLRGWQQQTALQPVQAAKELEQYCSEFLVTVIEKEGKMQGTDVKFIKEVKKATSNRVVAAGGVSSIEEVKQLEAINVDCVVGMALYTGRIKLDGVKLD